MRRVISPVFYAHAAKVWAIAVAILFVPCALAMLALAAMAGPFAIIMVLAIATTYYGAHLYLSGARMLLNGHSGWGLRLGFAPLATWNILIMFSVVPILGLVLDFPPSFVSGYFAVCAVLHIFVNAAFLIGLPFVRWPAADATESGRL